MNTQRRRAEKAEVEARLAKEVDLQAPLTDVRRVVHALHALPPLNPPRNFTLKPQQVGAQARRGPLFPVFRLAAALCTLLLVVAVARDLTTSTLSASAPSDLTAQGGAVTTLAAPNVAALATSTPEGTIQNFAASAVLPTRTPSAPLGVTPVSHLAPAGGDETATPANDQAVATVDATRKNLAPTETPEDTATSDGALPPSATETAAQSAPLQPAVSPQASLRVVEIVLAALALALAAGAWFTRRG